MRVIVGLGNPGPKYQRTRHNVGFLVVDLMAQRWMTQVSRHAFLSLVGDAHWRDEKILLVKPQTYMNRSGEAVARILEYYRLDLAELIVIHDDLDLPLGRLRIKRGGGGSGGNRGVASIIETLGRKEFLRIKIGIGRPPGRQDPAHFLLQPFTPQEEASILPAIDRAVQAVEVILSEGVEKAMAFFHTSDDQSLTNERQ